MSTGCAEKSSSASVMDWKSGARLFSAKRDALWEASVATSTAWSRSRAYAHKPLIVGELVVPVLTNAENGVGTVTNAVASGAELTGTTGVVVATDGVIEVGVEDVRDDLIPGSFIVSGILYSAEKHVKDFITKYIDEVRRA